ncbi:hypothetical protein VaNZ11_005164 [Volvox africanus]|uniref:Uncharacterized protein n=1 Tax=Volvox africanus TaxID=51714 RepID=A0ABQ5RY04_9CHLO|nr:hypothetical protein VaNZ11_005164 [Volvox africanus]
MLTVKSLAGPGAELPLRPPTAASHLPHCTLSTGVTRVTTLNAFLRKLRNPLNALHPPGAAFTHHSSIKSGRHRSRPRAGQDIELVTQVSLDRWPRFAQQALAWGGPVSVAVYIPCPPDHPLALAYQDYLQVLADDLRKQIAINNAVNSNLKSRVSTAATIKVEAKCHLTVSLIHSQRFAREGALVLSGVVPLPQLEKDEQEGCYDHLYPINTLRNAALRAATCSHVWLVDGDFIPSCGIREALLQPMADAYINSNICSTQNYSSSSSSNSGTSDDSRSYNLLDCSDSYPRPVMWVVPAFELHTVISLDGGLVANLMASGPVVGVNAANSVPAAAVEVPDSQAADVPRTFEQLVAVRQLVATGRSSDGVVTDDAPMGPGSNGPYGKVAEADSSTDAVTRFPTALRPFHCGRYPQPVASIDYERWWAASLGSERVPSDATLDGTSLGPGGRSLAGTEEVGEAVESRKGPCWITVPYHEYFEPYGIVRRDQVPLYDERFRGYGLNKVQHAYHMWAAGFHFRVLTKHFCVTVPHTRSVSYRAIFGTAADPQQRLRVEQLYEQFKQDMYSMYGLHYTAPQA